MADKPRNPRRPAGGPGERPTSFGRAAGKPVKGPGNQRGAERTVGGMDARAMETLEKEGLLTAEGRRMLAGAGGKVQMNRGLKVKAAAPGRGAAQARSRDEFDEPAERPARGERPVRGERKPAAARPVRGKGRKLDAAENLAAERLQKVMAQGGVASRRHSEELIQAGRVTVNGRVVTELGSKVVPGKDLIEVDGRPLGKPESLIYLVLNKPKGVVTTLFDPQGRAKVTDLLGEEIGERVYPVGRLDYDTEGLLLLTNDGELANALMHPAKMIKKTYIAKVRGVPGPAKLKQLEAGVELDDGVTAPADVKLIEARGPNTATVSIRIHEGRNRQVRRMFEALGHEVIHLKRTTLGPLHLKDLPLGQWRQLTPQEVKDLRTAAGLKAPKGELAEQRQPRQQRPAARRGAGRHVGPDRAAMYEQQEFGERPMGRRPARVAGPSPFAQPGEERVSRRPMKAKGPSPFGPGGGAGAVGLPTPNDEFERPDPPRRGRGGAGRAPSFGGGAKAEGFGGKGREGFGGGKAEGRFKGPDRGPGKTFGKGESRGPARGEGRGPAKGAGVRKTRSPK